MGEIVRYSMAGHKEAVQWPQRCPCCGTNENLTYSQMRAARESASMIGIKKVRIRTEWYEFPILTCKDHAFSNWVGGKVLEKTGVATILRGAVYFSLVMLLMKVGQGVIDRDTWHATMADPGSRSFFMCLCALGGLGLLLILWAKHVAGAYIEMLDKDQNVVILHFSNEKYARDFKRINIRATSNRLAGALPFFKRSNFIKVALFVVAIVIISIGRH